MQHFEVSPSPHIYGDQQIAYLMRQVLYALLPGIAVYVWFFGWGVVINIGLATLTALGCEAWLLWLRGRPLSPFLNDYSVVVTAWLFALTLPPFLPWWMTVVGCGFGVIFAKQLYGGLGYNPFNPAMVGYVVLLISFPVEMTHWPALTIADTYPLGFIDNLRLIFLQETTLGVEVDAISGATVLDDMKTGLSQFKVVSEIQENPLYGRFGAEGWEWIVGGYALGGIWLIIKKVIDWRLPVAMLSSLWAISFTFFLYDSNLYPSPLFHLFSGAAMLGAFFIVTDPVTAATSRQGRWIFGVMIGILVYVIRTWGGYPDGVAFAVLLANMAVPIIDAMTKPRVFGH